MLDSGSSSVTLFRATSPTPLMEYTLPFVVLNTTWFHQSPLSSDFSLVALTHKYDVVIMGDNVTLPEDPGASAKALQKGPAAPRRSLFEEMFGVPAITSLSSPNEQAQAMPDQGSDGDVTVPWRSSDTANFFDAPSHLMPPIETFFESLIDSFLRLRTMDNETHAVQAEDGAAEAEDDMPVDPAQETDLVNAPIVSNEAVLGVFVPLFKGMAGMSIRSPSLNITFLTLVADAPDYGYRRNKTAAPPKAINGSPKNHTRLNSRAPTKNFVHSDIQSLTPDRSTPSVTTKAGRKRSRPSLDG